MSIQRTVIERADLTCETAKFKGEEYQKQVYNLSVRPDVRYLYRCTRCMETRDVYNNQSCEVSWRAPSMNGTIVNLRYAPVIIFVQVVVGYFGNISPVLMAKADLMLISITKLLGWPYNFLELLTKLTLTLVGKLVGNCIKAAHNRLDPNQSLRLQGLKKICVDETSIALGHKYITVMYDIE